MKSSDTDFATAWHTITPADIGAATIAALAITDATANAALPKAGGVMTGAVVIDDDTASVTSKAGQKLRIDASADSVRLMIAGSTKLYIGSTVINANLPLTLPADPTNSNEAANKQYVDARTPVTDGDKGDIVVSGSGATWMLDSGVVTTAAKTVLDDTTVAAMLTTLGGQPLDSDLTAIAALAPANDTVIQRKAGAWVASTPATVKTDLALAKGDVGLGNVDNTSDANKPVSTAQAAADALAVLKAGDSMSGVLRVSAAIEQIQLARTDGSNAPDIGFYDSTFATRYGYVQGGPSWLRMSGGTGIPLQFLTAGSVRYTIRTDAVNEFATRVHADGNIRMPNGPVVWGASAAYFGLYSAATDADTIGTRQAYMGMNTGNFWINNEIAGDMHIRTPGVIVYYTGGAETTRLEGASQAWGRTTANYNTQAGFDIRNDGRYISTTDTANAYCWGVHISAADAASVPFHTFRRGSGTPTQIGSITQVATTGVNFNQTSHGPWKGNVTDIDDDEALERLMLWRPVAFQWKFDEHGNQSEEGTPSGPIEHGFIAQEMAAVNPNAVTMGHGVQSDMVPWQQRKDAAEAAGEEFTEPEPFSPAGGDWSKLVPDLSASMQALVRRVRKLEEAA
jgi:hypothetical protein